VIGGVVLDATAGRDIAARRTVYGQAFTAAALAEGLVMLIPAPALFQAWVTLPDPAHPTLELLLSRSVVVVEPLDQSRARPGEDQCRRSDGLSCGPPSHELSEVVPAQRCAPTTSGTPETRLP
jgi:hypothetical protein